MRLVEHALVAYTLGAGLVGIHPGHDEQLLIDLMVHFREAGHVFQHSVFPVRGAGADDQEQTGILSRQYIGDFPVPVFLDGLDGGIRGVIPLDLLGKGHLADKFHRGTHSVEHLIRFEVGGRR